MFVRPPLVLIVAVLVTSCAAFGQSSSASITGRITDSTKAVIEGATVVAINTATGVQSQVRTDNTGNYSISLLPPGVYRLEVGKQGFRTILQNNVTLHVQDVAAINFEMAVGSASESVTVEASGPVINTTDGTVSTVIDRNFVGNLPLNGRSFQTLIFMTPGVVPTSQSSDNAPGEFSVNGQRANANYFTVDGVSANTSVGYYGVGYSQSAGGALPGATALGTTSSMVSVDALQEFRIQTSTYSAEFGRQPGAQVQLVTRSGANQFHGTAFEYLRNDVTDAQDYFNTQLKLQDPTFRKPELRQNQFGGTFSGPIVLPKLYNGHDKTFFFFSYEGQRLRVPVLTTAPLVPAMWLRQAAAPVLQPFMNAFPVPNGPEIQTLEDPTQPYDPNTNPYVPSGFARFSTGYSNPSDVDAYSFRLDHTVNNKLRLFGRYARTPSDGLVRTLNNLNGRALDDDTLTLGATLAISSRLNNEFRFNYTGSRFRTRNTLDNFGGAVPTTVDKLLAPYSGPGPLLGSLNLSFFSNASNFRIGGDADNADRQLNLVDTLSWVKGRHQLKLGLDWRHLSSRLAPLAYGANLSISSYSSYSDFVQGVTSGIASSAFIETIKGARPIYDNLSSFGEDTWKITPRLNLDLGLRWEVNPAPHDANGVKPVMIEGINAFDVSNAYIAPSGTPFYKTIYTAFAPRVGAAYQLSQASGRELVLRGGFGVFYDLGSNLAAAGFGTFPFSAYEFLDSVQLPMTSSEAAKPAFPPVAPPLNNVGDLWALNGNLKLPYTLQWNLALEQALGKQQTLTLSYVASAGRRLTVEQRLNQVNYGTVQTGDANQYRPNPNFGDLLYVRNAPTSDYHSLQAQFQQRLWRGLQALASYTWSHAIDTASYDVEEGFALVRGNADFDVRHNFSGAVTYDVPRVNGTGPITRILKELANGWSVDSIFTARTGQPIDVIAYFYNYDVVNGRSVTIRPNLVPGQLVWIGDNAAPGGQRLNFNAFSFPRSAPCPGCAIDPIYQQGNLGRNSIRLPGIYQFNTAVRRQFGLGDRLKLQAEIEAFNVFNHPLFAGYDNAYYPGNTHFGLPTLTMATYAGFGNGLNTLYQQGGPRSIQLSLKLNF